MLGREHSLLFFFSSRRRHTRSLCYWSSDVCSSDLLGVEIRALRDDSDFQALIKGPVQGVVVHSIVPDGPAARSDLRPTDIITAIDGKAVGTAQQLKRDRKSVV